MTDSVTQMRAEAKQAEDDVRRAWIDTMERLIVEVATDMENFTSDDVFDRYDQLPPEDKPPTPSEARVFGSLMVKASRRGICRKSALPHRISRRKSLHRRPLQVWTSLIYLTKNEKLANG